MSNATSPAAHAPAAEYTRPTSCPFLILDAAGEIAGWCETEDGARTTAADWSRIDGATYTTRNVNA